MLQAVVPPAFVAGVRVELLGPNAVALAITPLATVAAASSLPQDAFAVLPVPRPLAAVLRAVRPLFTPGTVPLAVAEGPLVEATARQFLTALPKLRPCPH